MEYSNLFVCLMGIGTVFIGLVCIIILVTIMSGIVRKVERSGDAKAAKAGDTSRAAAPVNRPSTAADSVTPELIAAVSAAIAEEMGTDVGAIRIRSLQRVG